jgi:hypothetical protein
MREKIEIVTGVLENWMVFRDPPQHQRLRGALAKYFSPKEMERLRPRVIQIVDELIDSFAANGRRVDWGVCRTIADEGHWRSCSEPGSTPIVPQLCWGTAPGIRLLSL